MDQDQFKDLRAKFKRVQRNCASNFNRHVVCVCDLYDLMEQFTDSDSTSFVMKEIKEIRQMIPLYQNFNEGNPRADATPAAVDPKKSIDTEQFPFKVGPLFFYTAT